MNKSLKNLISVIGVILIIILIIKMKSIFIFIMMAVIFSFIGRPIMNKLSEIKIFKNIFLIVFPL